MPTPVEAAKNTVEVSKRHVIDQQLRIERHRELMAKLERDGHPEIVNDARRILAEMEEALAGMKEHYVAAQERLAQAAVDGLNLAAAGRPF